MNVLIIYAHPNPSSFNAALKDAAVDALKANGHSVDVSDLYAMKFDPVFKAEDYTQRVDKDSFHFYREALHAHETGSYASDILGEMKKVDRADLIIFQFPIWFSSWPAIIKGWIDRVFQAGYAFRYDAMYDTGLLKGKKVLLSITTGAPEVMYSNQGNAGDIYEMLRILSHVSFEVVGLEVLPPHLIFDVASMDRERGIAEIERYKDFLIAMVAT
ncbi:NAD(P)H-dependent oxidoreductase [Methanospirillum hungatei]|uniref:NAD(P)H-dependent oxidoreductase n=1 Tax=Methanospirillum hungatei TaxID=2203 RepID=UPI0026ECC44B|nr:NAD(P)H-dependent oxidoreductase [Methanospirillum hungatei]MCA1916455.1 NAD(P)H-dependent oxidoreductase [Methanospirillum hungatei]